MIDTGPWLQPELKRIFGTEVFKGLLDLLLVEGDHWTCYGGVVLIARWVELFG
jgi:hypothetical protein